MKSIINKHVYKVIICLVAFAPLSCNVISETKVSSPTIDQVGIISSTVVVAGKASEAPTKKIESSETFYPAETQTPLPTFVMPPTPAPPAMERLEFVSENTGLSFQYPANWYVY